MGFHRKGQPQALDRIALKAIIIPVVTEQVAFALRTADPFNIEHDCPNPAGHDFIASCGEVVCPHCARIA